MPVAASAGSNPRVDRMRTAQAWMLIPTPSGFSSLTASNTSTSKPARCRHIAATRPPIPAPAMTIFMSGVAAQSTEEERGLVFGPALGLRGAQLVQVGPAVDAGIVLVVEDDADGVVADRLDRLDLHMAPARHDLLGRRAAVALHLGGRAFDAQILGRHHIALAVGEIDLKPALGLEHAQLARPGSARSFVAAPVGNRFRKTVFRAHAPSFNWRASLTSMIGMPSRIG